ncbi:hypothetical protein [Streptomyces sp. NPDC055036]
MATENAGADLITLNSSQHGQFQTQTVHLDEMIREYGQKTPEELSRILQDESGDPNYVVTTITEGLMVLAEYRGYATN